MPVLRRNLWPNVITIARIVLAPVVFFLTLVPGFGARLFAFVVFVIAAVSDVWDGHLARKYGWITDFGKLVDPLADKLLLAATFVPFYILSHRPDPVGVLPHWGTLPLWVLVAVFGREVLITAVRAVAVRKGVVIPAGKAGKHKALAQNIFIGSTLLWYALRTAALEHGWAGWEWDAWQAFHGAVLALALVAAVALTVYSLVVYLRSWRLLGREAA